MIVRIYAVVIPLLAYAQCFFGLQRDWELESIHTLGALGLLVGTLAMSLLGAVRTTHVLLILCASAPGLASRSSKPSTDILPPGLIIGWLYCIVATATAGIAFVRSQSIEDHGIQTQARQGIVLILPLSIIAFFGLLALDLNRRLDAPTGAWDFVSSSDTHYLASTSIGTSGFLRTIAGNPRL